MKGRGLMDIFAIILNEANQDVKKIISDKYPKSYQISDTCFLVADLSQMDTSGRSASVDTISESIKMTGDDATGDILGLVVKLNSSYGGRNYKALWEWIETVKG
jgi:hypothetical protein